MAIVGPIVMSRFYEVGLASLGSMSQIIACLLFMVAGTSIPLSTALILSYPAILLFATGGFWNTANMALITRQYPSLMQGEVFGVISQVAYSDPNCFVPHPHFCMQP